MTAQIAVELGDRGIRCYDLEPGMVNTERVLAGGEALAFVAKFGKPPSAVGAAAAWLLRQPEGTVPNGSVVDTQVVGEQLGLVKDGVWTLSMTLPTMLPHDARHDARVVPRGRRRSVVEPRGPRARSRTPATTWTVELAAAAALTERVRLWTTIVILPAHDAVAVAKQMASIDVLSDGRLTVGVGVGGREHDYRAIGGVVRRAAGSGWTSRSRRCAASGRASRRSRAPTRSGRRRCSRAGRRSSPGVMGPKAIARAALLGRRRRRRVDDGRRRRRDGDGVRRRSSEAWDDAGRTDAPHLSSSIWYALGDDAEARLRGVRVRLHEDLRARASASAPPSAVTCFTPDALRAAVDNARDAGADEFFLVPTTSDPDELARTRDALGI